MHAQGISIVGAVCFIPPELKANRTTSEWMAGLLPECPGAILVAYAAGAVAVYQMRTWAEMKALGAEIPHGEYYVCLGCRAARGGGEQSYQSTVQPVRRERCAPHGGQHRDDLGNEAGIPHVKRWEGEP